MMRLDDMRHFTLVSVFSLITRCGVKGRNVFLMLMLALLRACVDTASAMLFALALYVLLGRSAATSVMPDIWPEEDISAGVILTLLAIALVVCKAILAPLLSYVRGQLIDRWSLQVSVAALEAELTRALDGAPQEHAQGRNITVNLMVSRVMIGGVFPSLDLVTESLVVTALLAYLSWHFPLLGGLFLMGVLLMSGVWLAAQHVLKHRQGEVRAGLQEHMHRWVTDSSACQREIQLYGRVPAVLAGYRPLAWQFAKVTSRERMQQDVQAPIIELALLFILGATLFGVRQHAEQLDIGAVALCSAIGLRLLPALRRMFLSMRRLTYVQASVEQLHALLDASERTWVCPLHIAELPAGQLLSGNAIAYAYSGTQSHVLHNLDLQIDQGEWLGLVGVSGAGKSTLVDLLIGQRSPTEGGLVWRHAPAIGYAGAQASLLPGTLRENVALLNEPVDDGILIQALSIAGMSTWLDRLPDGLDTPVTQFESHLSSGERQRLGLARAVLHAHDLLVLDEATAALDELTERRFLEALRATRPALAVLLITHRLSALRYVDRSVLLTKGKLQAYHQGEHATGVDVPANTEAGQTRGTCI
ncbi:ATP-binding cassette domain-containing protein [Pseudomonas sp. LRF_L74]|uniref:ATP-binding cassette domain-containing protein n=1 Tax=Pseudomonas sp. LRF_L74 TaxID=3369422 RepID=UPI003F5FEAB3